MKTIWFVLVLLGCGAPDPINCSVWGEQCHMRASPGPDGEAGLSGRDGVDGQGCIVTDAGLVECGNGTSFQIPAGPQGVAGARGEQGPTGPQGQPGETGEVGQRGETGAQGIAGQDGRDSVVEIIDPCGKESAFDEVLLRLSNGKLLAHYAEGTRQFITEVAPGSYSTTDGTGCQFTVLTSMEVRW